MTSFLSCVNKDRLEFIRGKKNLICPIVLLGCAAMVLLSTAYMPLLLDRAMEVTDLMSSDMSISTFMEKFFPNDLKGSLGIFSSDVGVFYSLTVIIMTYALLPNEISTGRLVLPLCAGHSKNKLFLSKQLVYSILCSFPVFPIYILYYYIGVSFLTINYDFKFVLFNAVLYVFAEFSIVYLTIGLSVLYKHKYMALATMAVTIMMVPDMLSFFRFGKFFPTYVLTYLYTSNSNPTDLVVPIIALVVIMIVMDLIIIKKQFSVDVDERR